MEYNGMQDANISPEYLTRPQMARVLGLTPRGVDSLTSRGVLPVVRISRRVVRYDPVAVRAALENLTTPARRVRAVPA